MANTPRNGRERSSHARGQRASHGGDGYRASVDSWMAGINQTVADGVVGQKDIIPGSIQPDRFPQDSRPVIIVSTLPTLPDIGYPVGSTVVLTPSGTHYRNVANVWTASVGALGGGIEIVGALPALPSASYPPGVLVFLTTDDKLYRNDDDVWSVAVDGGDIMANSILTNSIAAGAVTAAKIAANTITAAQIAAGTITATEIAGSTITGAKIAAGTITATNIAAGTITATEIAAEAITSSKLAIGAVGSDNLAPGSVVGPNLILNGSFENGDASILGSYVVIGTSFDKNLTRGWDVIDNTMEVNFLVTSNAKTGTRAGAFRTTAASSRMYQTLPVVAGRTYRLTGWHWKGSAGGVTSRIRAQAMDSSVALVTANVIFDDTTSGSPVFCDGTYTVPTDGTVSYIRVELLANGTPGGTEVFAFEDISLVEIANNVKNTDGNVVIDSTGITVTNGKISMQDSYGSTVLTGTGFSENWEDFISTGIYNGTFLRSNATTDLSDAWTLSGAGSFVALDITTASLAPGGFRVRYNTTSTHSSANYASLTSAFFPVTGPAWYVVSSYWFTTTAGSGVTVEARLTYYDKTQASISTTSQTFAGISTGFAVVLPAAQAPNNSRFGKIEFRVYNPATATVDVDVRLVSVNRYATTQGFIPPGVIVLWSGTSADVPTGWAICDGTSGTPDLTDRFVVGNNGASTGSGGTVSPTAALAHTSDGSGTTGAASFSGVANYQGGASATVLHNHSTPNHTHASHSIMKYYKLAYIMKT